MTRRMLILPLVILLAAVSGCHCCPVTEHYCDCVDRIADHEGCLAPNRPLLDVTRWGTWNGPACCRPNCCR
ncbi:MAG: hypothetical protein R3C49_01335 [Planctomycetaceae bacterium]